jgi:hypothetical protein
MEVPAGESASREGDILNRHIRRATGLDAEKQKASAPLIGRSLPFMNDATSYLLVLTN